MYDKYYKHYEKASSLSTFLKANFSREKSSTLA